MKKAFIVLGAESSGTRLMVKVLINGGCKGTSDHFQDFDHQPIKGDYIVWRRSVPHNHQDVYLDEMLRRLSEYEITIIVMVRNWDALEKSQIAAPHVSCLAEAQYNIPKAYKSIFEQLIKLELDYILIPYESLILNPVLVQQKIYERFGLSGEPVLPITNENHKWLKK